MRAAVLAVLLFAVPAFAQSTMLDPGAGTNYLSHWCGGQSVNEYAEGFNPDGMPTTIVQVMTSCHGSGRGSKNHYYMACWRVTFDWTRVRQAQVLINSGDWQQGAPTVPCSAAYDPTATYEHLNQDSKVDATLYTVLLPNTSGIHRGGYRAVLETQ